MAWRWAEMDLGGAIRATLAVAHVGSALLYVAGFVSTATLTHLARRAATTRERNGLLALSGRFGFLYQIPFGTGAGIWRRFSMRVRRRRMPETMPACWHCCELPASSFCAGPSECSSL